jgi:ABC-2 type transport system permease protein
LTFFPGIFGRIVFALPFAAIYSTPLLIYVGVIHPQDYARYFGVQVLWLMLFSGLSFFIWRAAARRVVIQGG